MTKTKHLERTERATANTIEPSQALNDFADYIARVVTHPQSPKALTDALCMVIVNIVSNESGYSWADDADGLRFMLPRLLFNMNEMYANGIIGTLHETVHSLLPEAVKLEIRKEIHGDE